MAGIRGSNTSPEITIRGLLHRHGFRYRLHQRDLSGRPDIVIARYHLCIFIQGCFWHRHLGCRYATNPRTREDFWQRKFAQNVARDTLNRSQPLGQNWRVIEIWECGIRGPESGLMWILESVRDCNQKYLSWPDLSGD
jgi:DNA mismatch endonuclease (patch repair protein)